ncbi:hypothetical protein, partial [Jeotgalibaca porci]|uniref:hypothetical protein n=1 Tax=Jeotgalibaca porci TaxID=1868793 RepID=UPI00359FD4F9
IHGLSGNRIEDKLQRDCRSGNKANGRGSGYRRIGRFRLPVRPSRDTEIHGLAFYQQKVCSFLDEQAFFVGFCRERLTQNVK